jgi:hypothetical protein
MTYTNGDPNGLCRRCDWLAQCDYCAPLPMVNGVPIDFSSYPPLP